MSNSSEVPMVTITQERHGELLEAERFLNHLENWGVDNWNGYGLARQSMREEDEEDDDE